MKTCSKSIKSEEFFKLIAVNSGISDLNIVKDIFYGMIKTISRELKNRQEIKLPDWGKFVLKVSKQRTVRNVNNGMLINLPPILMVKFIPDYKVKRYFCEFGEKGTML